MKVLRSVVCACAVFFAISSLGAMSDFSQLEAKLMQDPRYRMTGKRMEICKKNLGDDIWVGLLSEELDQLRSFIGALATTLGKEALLPDQEQLDAALTGRFCEYFNVFKRGTKLPDAQTLEARLRKFAPVASQSSSSDQSASDHAQDAQDALVVYKAFMQLPPWLGAKKIPVAIVLVAIENVVGMSTQHIADGEPAEQASLRAAMLIGTIYQDDQLIAKHAFEAYMKVTQGM